MVFFPHRYAKGVVEGNKNKNNNNNKNNDTFEENHLLKLFI